MTGIMKSYSVRIAWERFDVKRAVIAIILVLICCFSALFITARPAVAEKRAQEAYKYYTGITVRPGDTLWSIAEEQFKNNRQTASSYKGVRSYMKEVISLNDLNDGNYLLAGQKLIVPYYSSDYKS